MIERYTRPRLGAIFSDTSKYAAWLSVELAACRAWAELGEIPADAVAEIEAKAAFNVERVLEIENEVHHDVIAFLTNLAENIGPSSKYVHYGLTSSDVVDTALSLQMAQAMKEIITGAEALTSVLRQKAIEHKGTVMVGRTHGIHAEPTTFGHILLLWYFEMKRDLDRLRRALDVISVGKISGAVGNYANIDPRVEEKVCARLGLRPAEVSTQVLQRDRHAEFLAAIAITGASLEKFSVQIRSMQRTDILEAEEPFAKGQKGSSAMPHKKNPIISERVTGLARILRGNLVAALENVALWHERDISHSSVERVIIPDSCILLDYMLAKFTDVIKGLVVYPENMLSNLERTNGLVFSGRVLLALVAKGMLREDAYKAVQRASMKTWEEKTPLSQTLAADPEVAGRLSQEEIDACFDLEYYRKNVEQIFDRLDR